LGLKRAALVCIGVLTLLWLASTCYAPSLPDFPDDYVHPQDPQSQPRADWLEYTDVAVLVLGIAAASWAALKFRKRWLMLVLLVFTIGYFGFFREGCVCPIGAVQNCTEALFESSYTLPIFIGLFFLIPILFTLLFGRTFCAAICPLGAVQDVTGFKPMRIPMWLEHSLGLLAWVYLGTAVLLAALGAGYVICRYDPFVGIFRLGMSTPMLIVLGSILVIGVFVARPYCRFLCPLGAIFRIVSPFAWKHAKITPDECIKCRLCEDSCPYNAIRPPTEKLSVKQRLQNRRTLVRLLALFPLIIAAGVAIGRAASGPLANTHPRIRLARKVSYEQRYKYNPATKMVEKPSDETEVFYRSDEEPKELLRSAADLQERFDRAAMLLGGFIGLVVCLKLIGLNLSRTREDWEPDQARCFSCGRCFSYCPIEKRRRGELPDQEIENHDTDGE
jgi:ferredoxin